MSIQNDVLNQPEFPRQGFYNILILLSRGKFDTLYRVTHHIVSNLLLTWKHKFLF